MKLTVIGLIGILQLALGNFYGSLFESSKVAANNVFNRKLGSADPLTPPPPVTGNITNYNYTYNPSFMAKSLSALPHVSYEMKVVPSEWRLYHRDGKIDKTYISSIFFFPVLIGLLGLFCMIGLIVALIDAEKPMDEKLCFPCLPKFGPPPAPVIASRTENALWTHHVEYTRKTWKMNFFISMAVVIVACNLIFIFDAELGAGDRVVQLAMHEIIDTTSGLSDDIATIGTDLHSCEVYINSSFAPGGGCPQAESLNGYMNTLISQLDTFHSQVLGVADYANLGKQLWHQWFYTRASYLMWTLYCLNTLGIVFFIIAYMLTSAEWMYWAIAYSGLLTFIFLFMCTFFFIVLVGMGDFCMNPDISAYNSLPPGSEQLTAKFYATCKGQNPIHQELAQSYLVRDHLGEAMNRLYNPDFPCPEPYCNPAQPDGQKNPPCLDNINVEKSYRYLQAVHPILEHIASLTSCGVLHPVMDACFEYAICVNTFSGIYALWFSKAFTCLGFFMLLLSGSVVLTYFTTVKVPGIEEEVNLWTIKDTMEAKINNSSEDTEAGNQGETEALVGGGESSA